jgi:anti-anti-sigma factor
MTEQALFELRLIEDVPVIAASGELDMSNVHQFEGHFAQAAEYNRGVVVVSLAAVKYFDSRTIHALGMLAARLGRNRQRLAVVLPGLPSARMIFQMSGLQAKLDVFDTLDEALRFGAANRTELR